MDTLVGYISKLNIQNSYPSNAIWQSVLYTNQITHVYKEKMNESLLCSITQSLSQRYYAQ